MQLDQRGNFFTDSMQVSLHERSSNLNILEIFLIRMDKLSPRDCEDLLSEIYCTICVSNIRRAHIQTHMVAGDVEFVLLLEMREGLNNYGEANA